ncbi:hypothetical protein DFO66_110112, partial [Brevibacterium sanguinis]
MKNTKRGGAEASAASPTRISSLPPGS